MDRNRIRSLVIPIFENESIIVAAYLFGSIATGTENPMSDIDIAVLTLNGDANHSAAITRKLTVLLSEALDSMKVDLVCLCGADLALRYNVVRNGILIYERDPVDRVRFERNAMNEYIDMVPLWNVYDSQMLVRLKETTAGD